jgi:hypothetical protein
MSPWSLLAVPVCLGVMVLLLVGISWFEERLLSPRSLIRYTARSRHVGPDTVEVFIAAQSEQLLRSRGLVPQKAAAAQATQATPASIRS